MPSPVSTSAGLSARPDGVTQPLSFQSPKPWLPCPYQAGVVLPILGYLEIPQVIHLSAETMSHCSHCVAAAPPSQGAQGPLPLLDGGFAFWSTQNAKEADVVLCFLRLLLHPRTEAASALETRASRFPEPGDTTEIFQITHRALWRVRQFLVSTLSPRPSDTATHNGH